MPYIITTRTVRPTVDINGNEVPGWKTAHQESRTAVATLDEARTTAYRVVNDRTDFKGERCGFFAAADVIPESGGTIGPLPDGTVIEVRSASWMNLKIHTDLPGDPHGLLSDAAILAAFNAA